MADYPLVADQGNTNEHHSPLIRHFECPPNTHISSEGCGEEPAQTSSAPEK
jgi:hypothetical protein